MTTPSLFPLRLSFLKKGLKYSPIIMRISIALVFLWFGFNQIFLPEDFLGYLPDFTSSFNPSLLILLNGCLEVILGIFLILGLFTRLASFILAIHLLGIMFSLGYNEIEVRDFGLMMAAFAIFLHGEDEWCLDIKRK